jgi:hypothetical protein
MDEKFKVLLEYVEHRLLGKIVMGLKVIWKEIRPQKIDEYVKKKMQDWEANMTPQRLHGNGILCTTFFIISRFYKVFCHHSHGHTTNKR